MVNRMLSLRVRTALCDSTSIEDFVSTVIVLEGIFLFLFM